MSRHIITKTYSDFPAGHRQHLHGGHCYNMHGHDWKFVFTFSCSALDELGMVFDFGQLGEVKRFLTEYFDHTFLVAIDDPELPTFKLLHDSHLLQLRQIPATSCEGIAKFVYDTVCAIIDDLSHGRARLIEVTVWEDSKNSSTYR